eukprot:CAMPEP_0174242530 /NCGR_PEP_ID=MMETSP0417-20130205/28257_1 /TAXON_ID=242541 /ORGANISM="Mayorella sp, Strain BSH-02190019" /LENGTH=153 /DNA_ID=CAMNT_0015321941 /DNA_START=94 /DNA_END=551 /DNA_ORIENTATION=+
MSFGVLRRCVPQLDVHRSSVRIGSMFARSGYRPCSTNSSLIPPPTWSTEEFFSGGDANHATSVDITAETLDHLSTLAKLTPFTERAPAEQQRLLADVRSMLHHVETIQEVDTTDVIPLISLLEDEKLYWREDTPAEGDLATLKREAGDRMHGA